MDIVNLLKGVKTFKGLSENALKQIADIAEIKEYNEGEVIFERGSESDSLCILAEGQCDVKAPLGNYTEITVHPLNPGDIFGEIGFLDGKPRSATIIAKKKAKIIKIHKKKLEELIEKDKEIGLILFKNLSKALAERIRSTTEHFQNFYLKAEISFMQKLF